jgi:chromosome segregation ATPase
VEPQRSVRADEDEAVVPELIDRLEYQAAELTKLKAQLAGLQEEREKLVTELAIANRWVKSLAREVELADAQLKEMRPLHSRIGRSFHPA